MPDVPKMIQAKLAGADTAVPARGAVTSTLAPAAVLAVNAGANGVRGPKAKAKGKGRAPKQTPGKVLKKPAVAKNHIVWEGPGKPPVPKIGDVVLYKHSKIYVSASRRAYRVILNATVYATEKPIPFGGDAPNAASWDKVVKACNAYKPSK